MTKSSSVMRKSLQYLGSIASRDRTLSFHFQTDPTAGVYSAPYPTGTRNFFPALKQPQCEPNHLARNGFYNFSHHRALSSAFYFYDSNKKHHFCSVKQYKYLS
jgi:hypothetical protein